MVAHPAADHYYLRIVHIDDVGYARTEIANSLAQHLLRYRVPFAQRVGKRSDRGGLIFLQQRAFRRDLADRLHDARRADVCLHTTIAAAVARPPTDHAAGVAPFAGAVAGAAIKRSIDDHTDAYTTA